jgi:hypothetical protein
MNKILQTCQAFGTTDGTPAHLAEKRLKKKIPEHSK